MVWMTGQQVGSRYTLIRSLGHGGMGEVWEAQDDVLGRHVAVKHALPKLAAASPDITQLLRQETQAASHLFNHPRIVSVLDYFEDRGVPAIVFEYLPGVDGRTFARRYLARRSDYLTRTSMALHVVLCTAKALMFAHEKGVVHRDIKPENVLISQRGEVKLGDFGLAKFAQEATRHVTGKWGGTLLYAAPEQVQGSAASINSDIYQLGCLLYEMLEGNAPFEDEPNDAAIVYAKVHKPEPMPQTMNGLTTSEQKDVLELYQALIATVPSARWPAWQVVECLSRILHRPAWRMEFTKLVNATTIKQIKDITNFGPALPGQTLDFEDPDEALSESLALTLAGVGNGFMLRRPGALMQRLLSAARK